MTAEERNQRLSETFDAMETGEATTDDWWDAVFPTLEWCEYELKQLGFQGEHSALKLMRAHILLKADRNGPCWTDAQISEAFGCHEQTAHNVRI